VSSCAWARTRSAEVWPAGLPTQDRQLVPKGEDLQPLRATRLGQQRHEREQVTNGEIDKRPEQARGSPLADGKSVDSTVGTLDERPEYVCEPYGRFGDTPREDVNLANARRFRPASR
jgi:hypothetical protein